jgi:hypothetical protein
MMVDIPDYARCVVSTTRRSSSSYVLEHIGGKAGNLLSIIHIAQDGLSLESDFA